MLAPATHPAALAHHSIATHPAALAHPAAVLRSMLTLVTLSLMLSQVWAELHPLLGFVPLVLGFVPLPLVVLGPVLVLVLLSLFRRSLSLFRRSAP